MSFPTKCFLALVVSANGITAPAWCEEQLKNLADVAKGWRGEVIAEVPQTFVGWDIEVGDPVIRRAGRLGPRGRVTDDPHLSATHAVQGGNAFQD